VSIPHPYAFDPTYGFSPGALRELQWEAAPPPDFADFWQGLYAESQQVPLHAVWGGQVASKPGYVVEVWHYDVLGDYRVGGWLLRPEDTSGLRLAVVHGHGYGGREGPELEYARPDQVHFFPVAPGFQISAAPGRIATNNTARHVIHGLGSRDTYLLRSCAAVLWRAIDVLIQRFAGQALAFHYHGWSFGGGMGALMLPWESRYATAELGQPTFGYQPFRLSVPCVGSGEAVRLYAQRHADVSEVLAYFDAVFAARLTRQPVVYACCCFDPSVPPPGQFAVANAHPGPKRISTFSVGHFDAYVPPTLEAEWKVHAQNQAELFYFLDE